MCITAKEVSGHLVLPWSAGWAIPATKLHSFAWVNLAVLNTFYVFYYLVSTLIPMLSNVKIIKVKPSYPKHFLKNQNV